MNTIFPVKCIPLREGEGGIGWGAGFLMAYEAVRGQLKSYETTEG